MNFTEKVNRDKLKPGFIQDRSHKFVQKPFISFHIKQRNRRNKKDSTPSSKINWGTSCQSVTSSCGVNTESSSKENARIVIALSEGRGEARCEVGIAVINVSQPHLILCQISDTQSYDNMLRKINIFNPSQILVPMTFVESANQSRLIEKVKEQFPQINCTAVKRNTYNKASGMEYVQELCVPSLNSVLLILQHRYYALTAASALLKFLQNNLNIFYASGSIKIDYQESEGYAIIDISTADRLELVSSTRPFQASKYSTLFGVLNGCYTRIGERALRTLLLQPPFDTQIILERQEAVTALVNQQEKLQAIQAMLQKIGNIDQLLILPTIVVDDSQYWSERQLNYMLYLNGVSDLIMTLSEVVIDMKETVFANFCNTMRSQDFLQIRDTVRTLIHENAYCAKSQTGLTQRCFAIKPGINGLLDLVRKIYSERLDDMREYVKVLGEKYDLPLILGNNASKGYHIVLGLNKHQKRNMKKSDLPPEFIQVCRLAGSYTMKTMEIINFQTRVDDIVADIMKISNVMIFKTLSSFKKYMGIFYNLCEHISNIDVVQSLATVSLRNNYVKPTFGGYTEVKDSQHPMLEMLANEKPVPNLISSCEDYNIHIITGPNGSGKSIFIRQVMLLQIMAQIGGYVPASSATFRPADRLFARIYLDDNMECGASSFVLEIKEIIYILSHITNNSMVIMDELGRSTSLEEGSALAMAVCERLSDSTAFVYLTSHFTLVTKLADLYLNIRNWHMDTEASGNTPRTLNLDFKYHVKKGVTNLRRYGIFMVKTLWPADILEDVYRMIEKSNNPLQEVHTQKISDAIRRKYQLESNLRKLKAKGKLNISIANKLINQYRNELESQNIILENITFGNSVVEYLRHTFSNQYPNPYSGELSNDATDVISNSSDTRDFDNSSYRMLSQFLEEDSKNLNLLNPEIQISFADTNSNQTAEEEINPINQSLFAAVRDEKKTERVNILSNILLNQYTMNDTNVDELVENAVDDNFQMKNYSYESQEILANSQQSNNINATVDWSLLIENQLKRERVSNQTQGNCHSLSDSEDDLKTVHSQIPIQESDVFKFPMSLFHSVNNSVASKQKADIQFRKPGVSPFKRRNVYTNHHSENLQGNHCQDEINQFHFSLPLLQNQNRTSTPIVSGKENFVDDSLTDMKSLSNYCPNKNFYNDGFSFGESEKKAVDLDPKDDTKHCHIYPEIEVIEGPNNSSISFGEEDKKQGQRPLSSISKENIFDRVETDGDIHEENPDFEDIIKKEVKLFLSQSADLFEGDVNSLDITVENYQKSKPSQKITHSENASNNNNNNEDIDINDSLELSNNTKDSFNTEKKIYKVESFSNIAKNCGLQSEACVSPIEKWAENQLFKNYEIQYALESNISSISSKASCSNHSNAAVTSIEMEQKHSDLKNNYKMFDFDSGHSNRCLNQSNYLKNDSKIFDKKEKVTTTTSISEASRLRNLEITSSDRSSDTKSRSDSSKKKETITSGISDASRCRNLSSNIAENLSSSSRSKEPILNEEMRKDFWSSYDNDKNNTSRVNSFKLAVNNEDSAQCRTGDFSISTSSKCRQTPSKIRHDSIQATSGENSNYKTASDEDIVNDKSEIASRESNEETKAPKKRLGYTRRSSNVSNKRGLYSDLSDTVGPKRRKSIVGPFKLTKNEIQDEFDKQDEILLQGDMDVSAYSKYLNQRMNRPSVRQLQNAEHVATIRKTDSGTLVSVPLSTPAKRSTLKTKKYIETTIIAERSNCFDLSIFSDQNANKMAAFLASNEMNYNQFKFDEDKDVSPNFSVGFASQVTRKRKFGRTRSMGGFKLQDCTKISHNNSFMFDADLNSSLLFRQSQRSGCSSVYIPEGYFKENKKEIEDICSKYLTQSNFMLYRTKTSPI